MILRYICLPSSIREINYDVIISNTEAGWLLGTCSRSTIDTHPLLSWFREAQSTMSCVGQVICLYEMGCFLNIFPSKNMFQLKNFYDSLWQKHSNLHLNLYISIGESVFIYPTQDFILPFLKWKKDFFHII